MEKLKYFAKGFWVDKHLAQWITTIVIMVNFGLGAVIFASGSSRFTSPSYDSLSNITNGNLWIWAVWIMASAVLMSLPFRWPNIIGLWLSMLWNIIWMTGFAIAAIHDPGAAATPIPVYAGFAMVSAALLTARVIDKTGG